MDPQSRTGPSKPDMVLSRLSFALLGLRWAYQAWDGWAMGVVLHLELDPTGPDMGPFTFEFCPLRPAMGLTRRGMDGQ